MPVGCAGKKKEPGRNKAKQNICRPDTEGFEDVNKDPVAG
jgi:hypothetical protein